MQVELSERIETINVLDKTVENEFLRFFSKRYRLNSKRRRNVEAICRSYDSFPRVKTFF